MLLGGWCLGKIGLLSMSAAKNFFLSFSGLRTAVRHRVIVAATLSITITTRMLKLMVGPSVRMPAAPMYSEDYPLTMSQPRGLVNNSSAASSLRSALAVNAVLDDLPMS